MKLDSVTGKIVAKLAKKHNINHDKAFRIICSYYNAIRHVGLTSDKATLIGIENIGKLVYNEKYQLISAVHQENYQMLKRKKQEDAINSTESGN
jgi:hypothetical protein